MEYKDLPVRKVVDTPLSDNGDEAGEAEPESGTESAEESALANEPLYVQAAFEFLGRKHCTLWGDFIIADHHGRLRAARWLAQEMAGVEKVLTSNWQPV